MRRVGTALAAALGLCAGLLGCAPQADYRDEVAAAVLGATPRVLRVGSVDETVNGLGLDLRIIAVVSADFDEADGRAVRRAIAAVLPARFGGATVWLDGVPGSLRVERGELTGAVLLPQTRGVTNASRTMMCAAESAMACCRMCA